jgi:hypothetical protein
MRRLKQVHFPGLTSEGLKSVRRANGHQIDVLHPVHRSKHTATADFTFEELIQPGVIP